MEITLKQKEENEANITYPSCVGNLKIIDDKVFPLKQNEKLLLLKK